jgi:two-component system sensor histidine kinase CpxA
MIAQRKRFFSMLDRFFKGGVFFVFVAAHGIAFAAIEQEQRPQRIPPKPAIEACEGKKESDPCTFNTRDGVRNGECLAGVENVFACRPHPGALSPEAAASSRPRRSPEVSQVQPREQQTEPKAATQPETRTLPKTGTEPVKPVEPSPDKPHDHQAKPPEKDSHEPQVRDIQTRQIESSPVSQSSPDTGSFLKPVGYIGDLGYFIVVAIIAAGLTWYGLFRYYAVPLRRLRKVTQQLAGGNLSARVGEGLLHRKNEVVDLGRDVDRMAERIESLVGAHQRLIRDVSHELRSPLARLNVALELARQSAGPAHSAPFDRIERESERLNELIGQLLMLTKLESDSGTIKRADIDIAALIVEVAQDVDFEARSNDRRVLAAPSEPLFLSGNKELLRQALENLVRNAARYTATGTAVEISLRKKDSGGRSWAHIEVRDQGPGVPESALYDIFRPFYRVNDARERQSGGTGVGLAISDRAVRLHGGSLRAFNAPGVGLIMEMELPLAG